MAKFIIQGGKKLSGSVKVGGAKNAALKFLPAASILEGTAVFTNVPQIEDIHRQVELMQAMGLSVNQDGSTVSVTGGRFTTTVMEPGQHQKIRSSIMLVGPVLLRNGEITFSEPGGCVLGSRPIDFFLKGFEQLGAEVSSEGDEYKVTAKNLRGARVVFPRVSWTGTEALMTFATLVPGKTELVNCAMEPEVVELAKFLNACGARISGAGTPFITIEGVDKLTAVPWKICPDRLEAGTFAVMAVATNSHVTITDCRPEDLSVLWELLKEAGVKYSLSDTEVEIFPGEHLKAIPKNIVTHEYPGLPTDLQAPLTLLMTQSVGKSLVFETIYDGRLFYTDVLNGMGADILMCDPHRVLVTGPTQLYGRRIASPDLRAGITLVIAGLIAEGETVVENIYQIDRGYERIEERLRSLGADIVRL